MDVGAALRDAREQRGISLDELSRTTKISAATLRALERNQIDRLPGGIFVRGFLRAYAHEMGLDVEDTVQRYLAQFESRFGAVVATDTDGTRSESTRLGHSETDINESSPRGASMRLLLVGSGDRSGRVCQRSRIADSRTAEPERRGAPLAINGSTGRRNRDFRSTRGECACRPSPGRGPS